ncbi:uncharacterized protein FA14DRAFT_188332 [Meira miltonrushii]|uniref:C2H2-type domain-containing protein n=1 Tax=Meira miltonrushii TaxID=1280837 RepID=A0A316VL96_9BASI|nr:uncharacterized protein FA14DRAFT_188332 [Meira miltonrushii]PWN38326.1 hypothetical protein FA14DRAFT_188332 [Meira miltonrushii]
MSATSTASAMPNSSMPGGSATQSGPPYLCPTCQTTYSRLEYLRRHERRHADIRPFVCDCGKGFSRSDVLSRHKRQCAVHLNGGSADGDTSIASNGGSSGRANNGVGRRASSGRQNSRKSSTNGTTTARANGRKSAATASGERSDSLQNTPDDDDDDSPQVNQQHQQQSQPPHHLPMSFPGASQPHPASNMTNIGNSFPFPPQPGVQLGTSAPPPLLPPAPYGTDANGMILPNVSSNQPFPGMMPPHLSNFTNIVNPQHHYPSSPESNGTMSQHSSPRFSSRDMARHGSNGSRFSLRKGGSFDHIGPRSGVAGSGMTGTTPNQYAPEFWDALDPAAKNNANDYVSAGGSGQAPLSLADTASGMTLPVSGGLNGVTTPRGEPQRFAVSTGPLSPFSSIALSSTMSPYLSAFSNARDTPFVASPSRGIIPGTPGASLNVFDWTMRPPSKPASSSMSKRDSISQQGQSGSAIERSQSAQGGANEAKRGSSPSPAAAAAAGTDGKRKREDDEEGRKIAKVEDEVGDEVKKEEGDAEGEGLSREEKEPSHDEDQRTAAELLDSLRNAGSRSSQATFSDAGNVSVTSASSDQQAALSTVSTGEAAMAVPAPAPPVSIQSPPTEAQPTTSTATSVTTTS